MRICVRCGDPFTPINGMGSPRYCAACRWPAIAVLLANMSKVRAAIKRGDLPPQRTQACVDCGGQATMYDHRDVTQPLAVEPVCRGCNVRRGPPRWPRPASSCTTCGLTAG